MNDLEITLPEYKMPHKPEGFVTKFPYGKVPAFEDSEGWKLVEGAPIARYRKRTVRLAIPHRGTHFTNA